eukprot:scaffold22996_cov14-Tisochrysis_lutea.AAC.1
MQVPAGAVPLPLWLGGGVCAELHTSPGSVCGPGECVVAGGGARAAIQSSLGECLQPKKACVGWKGLVGGCSPGVLGWVSVSQAGVRNCLLGAMNWFFIFSSLPDFCTPKGSKCIQKWHLFAGDLLQSGGYRIVVLKAKDVAGRFFRRCVGYFVLIMLECEAEAGRV